jgi:drug/metabolite transporter (DMT)-like permease
LWIQTVVWTSIIGSFLTLFGLYLGIAQWGRKNGRLSPYRGMFYWHHITGVLFGIVALAFVASGLISVNPWGFLEGRAVAGEREGLEGLAPRCKAVRASVDALQAHTVKAVHLSLSPPAIFSGWPLIRTAPSRDGTLPEIRLL